MAVLSKSFVFSLVASAAVPSLAAPFSSFNSSSTCRAIPGDAAWPSTSTWQGLNDTVNGQLIATVPISHVCHQEYVGTLVEHDTFSESECASLKESWLMDMTFILQPAEIMNPYYQNQTCDPYSASSRTCSLGNYVSYSINVTSVEDVQAGIQFAKENNVRLVIKNTGHDFMGRSTGTGGLALWTHNMNHTEIIDSYSSDHYTGPAAKVGAGVVGAYVYPTVADAGYRILGGTCQTVGMAGGYTAGGGHSILNSLYGMAADAVLEWELVTADGEHLVATPNNENSELYWAMTGGGAGTWGVVISMTTKIFPDGPVGSGNLTFAIGQDNYWNAIEGFWNWLPDFVDAGPRGHGNTFDFSIGPTGFATTALFLPDNNATQVLATMQPLFNVLDNFGVNYTWEPLHFPSYLDFVDHWFGHLADKGGPSNLQLASRLIPREGVLDAEQNSAIVDAMKAWTDAEWWTVGCHALKVSDIEHADNAVLPQWRKAVANCNIASLWDTDVDWSVMQQRKVLMRDTLMPGLEDATQGAGSYLNELDAQWKGGPTGWKNELYGVNYERLLGIKEKVDPEHLFYAQRAVGSDYWEVDGEGRLCVA